MIRKALVLLAICCFCQVPRAQVILYIPVSPGIEALREGRDEVMERCLAQIRKDHFPGEKGRSLKSAGIRFLASLGR